MKQCELEQGKKDLKNLEVLLIGGQDSIIPAKHSLAAPSDFEVRAREGSRNILFFALR